MEKSTIDLEALEEEDDFLVELAAIEAEAEAARRPKVAMPEGPYMAALKGSKSEQWQASPLNPASKSRRVAATGGFGGGVSVNSNPAGNYGSEGGEQEFPEKNCPCGVGICLVLTSNTQKNPGRKFYKCPTREENGGCGFFQWCDAVQTSGTQSYGNTTQNSKFPDHQCPCGAGVCRILTAKTGENIGRQFYRCPVFEGSCGYFKWCNDDVVSSPKTYNSNIGGDSDGRGYPIARTGTPHSPAAGQMKSTGECYKCGKEGHWARDCTVQSGNPGPVVKSSTSGGDCYKCGKQWHWARDCTAQSGNLISESAGQMKPSPSAGECYKCGKHGHWSRDCTAQSASPQFQSGLAKSASAGDCYKCGKPGHWARDCTLAPQSTTVPAKRQRQY